MTNFFWGEGMGGGGEGPLRRTPFRGTPKNSLVFVPSPAPIFTRQPENSKRAHLQGPGASNTNKSTRKKRKKSENGTGEGNKRENWASHPSGAHFSEVWAPPLRAPTPSGHPSATPSGPHSSCPNPSFFFEGRGRRRVTNFWGGDEGGTGSGGEEGGGQIGWCR